jgi:rare lipoprotein A
MIATGTAPVKVESLNEVSLFSKPVQPANPAAAAQPAAIQPTAVQPANSRAAGAQAETVWFHPAIPEAYTGKNYRVQVGAYKEFLYAEEAYKKLKNAGLNPDYEKYGDFYRVVLPGLKQEELAAVSERLGRAGFREAVLREEQTD